MQTNSREVEDLKAQRDAREAASARAVQAKTVVKSRRQEILHDTAEQLLRGEDLDQIVLPMLYRALAAERIIDASLGFVVTEGRQTMTLGFIKGFPEDVVQRCLTLDFGQAVCGRSRRRAGPCKSPTSSGRSTLSPISFGRPE